MMTRFPLSSIQGSALSVLATVATLGLMIGTAPRTLAQVSTSADPLKDIHNDGSSDPFSNRGGNQTSSMMDFIHRAMQGQSQSSEDFTATQRENLNEAAEAFRKAQRERLANPQAAPAVPTPVVPSTPK